jgi:hypothetical protein
MMVEPVSVGLGISVGKAVLKSWLKDNEFASDMADSISEMVSGAINGWEEKNAAVRQIERISQKATNSIQAVIEYEWGSLTRNQKLAICNVVQNVIDSINIDCDFLSGLDFNPDRLSEIIYKRVEVLGLEGEEATLSYRLTIEASQLIVDLSEKLPNFTRESFSEILSRETEIMLAVDRLFEEIKSIREKSSAAHGNFSSAQFEESYRRSVVRRLDRIELYGLNAASSSSSRQHNLTTAYISLSASGLTLNADNDNEEHEKGNSGSERDDALNSVRIEEIAIISNRLVVKGEAGSGKTTLLQSFAVRCASGSFVGDLDDWNSLVPFFIPLRALGSDGLPKPEDFPGLISPSISGTMPHGWVHEQLSLSRCLLLIDGLDEVSEDKRASTRSWIEDLLGSYPDCKVIITSRPPAIPDGWLGSLDFTEIELLPMSHDDVSSFIDHWHDAVAGEEREGGAAAETRALGPVLKDRIRSDRSLRELASSPLLCAMLCAMNRDRREVLPSNRLALYEAATYMILHARDEQRKIRISDLPALDFETKRDLLQEIAFWMMENGLSMADEWRLVDLVERILPRFSRIQKSVSAELIVKSLLHRSGILRSPIEEKCDFIHNAFKEYLAARAVSDGDRFGYLESAVSSNEAWREVAPMAAALTDSKRRTLFLHELIKRGDTSSSRRVMYHLLAVRCLETCTQLEPETQSEILSRIGNLRQPRSVAEAKALSAAGDLATNLVRKLPGQHARTAASCVRALKMIGTPAALDMLEPYGPDIRSTVVKELLGAWSVFDRNEYARRVLSKSKGLWGGLRVDAAESLEGVRYLSNLSRIEIRSRTELLDKHISEFSNLLQLNSIKIRSSGKFDMGSLSRLSKLLSISVESEYIDNIDAISVLRALNQVEIYCVNSRKITNCDLTEAHKISLFGAYSAGPGAIATGKNLTSISVPHAAEDFDISFLENSSNVNELSMPWPVIAPALIYNSKNFSRMRSLTLQKYRGQKDLSFLENMRNLKRLVIRDADELCSFKGSDFAKDLSSLTIRGSTSDLDLRELTECSKITQLYLSANVEESSLSSLAYFENLQILSVPAKLVPAVRKLGLKASLRSAIVPVKSATA